MGGRRNASVPRATRHSDDWHRADPHGTGDATADPLTYFFFSTSRNGVIRSSGSGNTMVEFLSAAITVRVSR